LGEPWEGARFPGLKGQGLLNQGGSSYTFIPLTPEIRERQGIKGRKEGL